MPDWNTLIILSSLIAPVFALIVVGVLISSPKAGRRARRSPNWLWAFAKCCFWVLLALIVIALSALLWPMAVLIATLSIGLLIRFALICRDSVVTHVFSTLGAGMRQHLPLPTAIQSEAESLKGRRRMIMQRISHWLTEGFSLSESLRRGYPQCPGYAFALIAAAEQIDQIPQAIAAIEAHLAHRDIESQKFQPVNSVYAMVVLAFAASAVGALMVFVIPKFRDMFSGTGIPLPWVTNLVFSGVGALGVPIVILMAVTILVLIPMAVYLRFRPRLPEQPYLLSRIGDRVKWRLPLLRWFERNHSLVQTVSFLRLSLNAGSPLDRAIAGAASLDVNICYRRRLSEWLRRVQQGRDVAEGAKESRVGPALAWAFDGRVNPGNAPAVLESLESSYRSNYSYVANLAGLILWPCATILLAGVVGTIVYAMFVPMVALIESTMQGVLS